MSACEVCHREKATAEEEDGPCCFSGTSWADRDDAAWCLRLGYERVTRELDEAVALVERLAAGSEQGDRHAEACRQCAEADAEAYRKARTAARAWLAARKAKEAPNGR